MAKYITKAGDMLDDICYQYYGTEALTFRVLEANRDLSEYGEVLPSGLEINLPDFP